MGMFFLGAFNSYSALTIPKPDTSDRPYEAVFATILLLAGLALLAASPSRAPRLLPRLLIAAPLYGITVISAMIGAARPMGTTPYFYLWPVLMAAYFYAPRYVGICVAWMSATLAVALAFFSTDLIRPIMFIGITTSVGLVAALVTLMRRHQDTLLDDLYRASTTDSLTGLLNRRAFESAFEREVGRAARSRLSLSLVLFDLDHFKTINDVYGHAGGDKALQRFSVLLQSEQSDGDLVARIGGEEFAVALFDADGHEAQAFAERLGRRLRHETLEGDCPLSVSAGVTTMNGDAKLSDFMLLADRALYAAKASGRARTVRWDDGPVVGPSAHGEADAPIAA
jgi:diguanylate cyclase (GGDEF)-like protein